MIPIYNWQELSQTSRQKVLSRAAQLSSEEDGIKTIISRVKAQGDEALHGYTREFDGIKIQDIKVSAVQIDSAAVGTQELDAICLAIKNLRTYHNACLPKGSSVSTACGIDIERLYRPINKVGLYMPGGNSTPLISSLLMQAIPAQIAGCPIKILCTPPNRKGEISPYVLVAAKLCGIQSIYAVGGAQAIAAMAYGTNTIPKVDKIFGPGNRFVTVAKSLVALDPHGAAIDMPAGPSEVMIMADDAANPQFVAADLLAQAEHGSDSQVILLCDTPSFSAEVQEALKQQVEALSRKDIIRQALVSAAIIICKDRNEQISIVNEYAPEHLIINTKDPESLVSYITVSGTIFLGPWAAETMGDYITGSNHVLPTNGFARNHSGLNTIDFLNSISVQRISNEGVLSCGDAAALLANLEGLDGHANAINIRLNALR